jgi:hypothetical protein
VQVRLVRDERRRPAIGYVVGRRPVSLAVFDIDGVVADVRHRLHHLDGRWQDWDGFFAGAADDAPLADGLQLVLDQLRAGHDIAWLTGRPEWLRRTTRRWLTDQALPADALHMRPNGDYRPARRFKVDVLHRLATQDIVLFVDDDPDVVAAATAAGFPTTMATWVPHDKTLRAAQEDQGRT